MVPDTVLLLTVVVLGSFRPPPADWPLWEVLADAILFTLSFEDSCILSDLAAILF